ncbi:hypothetical protein [Amycolatopsis sp. H20-H5]|uniref:hypothetical protein n=1 Tax=Amycolatopsis sp. H20-H5 TaxID=3046309 RepID=UPI002DBD9001|nr:hypothetical protein [Amycolatopsis sp. H20-H5]MEC3976588.1 hypothetical protein [Amycolatopsis sp. H20-H5]
MTTPELLCVLPGCDELIEPTEDTRMQRKYCCAAHRIAARRLRQEVRADVAVADVLDRVLDDVLDDIVVGNAVEDAVENVLAEARESEAVAPVAAFAEPGKFVKVPLIWRNGSTGGMTTLLLDRHKAIPAAGRVPSPAPRLEDVPEEAASAPAHAASVTGNLTAATMRNVTAATSWAKRAVCRVRISYLSLEPRARWTVTVVMSGILIGGAGAWAAAMTYQQDAPVQSAARQDTTLRTAPPGMSQWTDRARAVLLSIRTQVGEINPAKVAWSSVPEGKRTGELAAKYAELQKQEAELLQKEKQLQSALGNTEHFTATTVNLSDTEAESASLSQAAAVGVKIPRGDAVPIDGTADQIRTLEDRCTALQRELAGLHPVLVSAMAAPLPGSNDGTIDLVNAVIRLAQQASAPEVTPPSPDVRAEAAAPQVKVKASGKRTGSSQQQQPAVDTRAFAEGLINKVLTGVGFG